MSDTIAGLRRTIDSAGELQSVVRTMKAMAASSIGQYEQSVRSLGDYARTVELGLGACFRTASPGVSSNSQVGVPSTRSKPQLIGAVVFGSDQGLVGQFNEVIVEYAGHAIGEMHGTPKVWAVGQRAHSRLADTGWPPVGLFHVPSSVKAITPLIGEILVAAEELRSQGDTVELHLFYNRPMSAVVYEPVHQQLLPLDEDWQHRLATAPWPTHRPPQILGSRTATLRTLIREYLFVSLFRACAESLASENASRLSAMQRAEKNIEELLEDLNGKFHRLRQSTIDEELFDVVSGFDALSNDIVG
ncbi:F0F1 ATP synthase subunit gamma [Rhodopirellula sp. SWK7]|uniref:F0F1 ATP synthase subunit gamma n=1 Tax=Rhodopirellula sp. SWK7 TaxID=595460 RepID=UPI0002BE58C0|nr:F0F1 ATP synthase subunit gamma [Rhodopirellula sp. SWK7]EMI47031.1 ATP synthase F1, H+-transporting two-sector ATPase gamma subunit [Rhodopirellula sp. SWK7]